MRNYGDFCGTEDVKKGRLKGLTDTDYFYFLCPKCNDLSIMRILDYFIKEIDYKYPEVRPHPKKSANIAFEIYCPKCKIKDHVKIPVGGGWQGVKITDLPAFKDKDLSNILRWGR